MPNFVVRNIINDKDFLGISIVNRVKNIEESYFNYDNLCSEYQALRDSFAHFELECHECFQEIRRQIDLHREQEAFDSIRDHVDAIALDMIDRTKDFEKCYFKRLNEKLQRLFQYNIERINSAEEMVQVNEMLRDPNQTVDFLKQKQRALEILEHRKRNQS